jgi:hypothetical protein
MNFILRLSAVLIALAPLSACTIQSANCNNLMPAKDVSISPDVACDIESGSVQGAQECKAACAGLPCTLGSDYASAYHIATDHADAGGARVCPSVTQPVTLHCAAEQCPPG